MTRHDIPDTIKNLIAVTLETNLLDAADIYAKAIEFGADFSDLVDDLCNVAHCNRHTDGEGHDKVVGAAEKFWIEEAAK